MASENSPPIDGVLLITSLRLMFIEERKTTTPPYVLRYTVNLWDIRGITNEGFINKILIIKGTTNNSPWTLTMTEIYDIDQGSFQTTGKVDMDFMQAYILEKKANARR